MHWVIPQLSIRDFEKCQFVLGTLFNLSHYRYPIYIEGRYNSKIWTIKTIWHPTPTPPNNYIVVRTRHIAEKVSRKKLQYIYITCVKKQNILKVLSKVLLSYQTLLLLIFLEFFLASSFKGHRNSQSRYVQKVNICPSLQNKLTRNSWILLMLYIIG